MDENNDGFIGIIFRADDLPSYHKYVPLVEYMIDLFSLLTSDPNVNNE
jgi:hypothetical protein